MYLTFSTLNTVYYFLHSYILYFHIVGHIDLVCYTLHQGEVEGILVGIGDK